MMPSECKHSAGKLSKMHSSRLTSEDFTCTGHDTAPQGYSLCTDDLDFMTRCEIQTCRLLISRAELLLSIMLIDKLITLCLKCMFELRPDVFPLCFYQFCGCCCCCCCSFTSQPPDETLTAWSLWLRIVSLPHRPPPPLHHSAHLLCLLPFFLWNRWLTVMENKDFITWVRKIFWKWQTAF